MARSLLRLDLWTVTGLGLGLSAIVVGQVLEGGHLSSLFNGPALVMVFGGTLGASLVQTPWSIFQRALKRLRWIIWPPQLEISGMVKQLLEWSHLTRREGLLGLERLVDSQQDSFTSKGLQLLVDGHEPEDIRHTLELEVELWEDGEQQAAEVFEGMGGYAPTIGILGAVIGLIHVMENLAEPDKLGSGIAAAFVATIYGVGLANLIFLPIANKLKAIIHRQGRLREMLIEGIIAIAHGENPRHIATKLQGFIEH